MSKEVYFNNPQRLTQLIAANTTVIVAGRRTGKTDSIAAPFALRNMQRMPGSTGGIVVPTFKHGLTNTLPGLLAAWKRWGFINGLHYVVGRKPPKSFAKPIIEPSDFEHVISFYNGSCAVIISQDRPGSSNSLTLSWLLVDEAKFIDYQKLKDETLPANGGIKSHFGMHSCNHSMMVLSDMPQTQKGSWFLHYEDKMDKELIATIEGTIYEIWRIKERIRSLNAKGAPVPDYLRGYLRRLDTNLNKMRSVAVYYKEYSSIENLQLLGENYIKQMKRDLTPLTFQTSILCQRIGIAKDGFYSSMREGHKYNASDFSCLDGLFYDTLILGDGNASLPLNATSDADVDRDAPICIGMDYNANINWIVAIPTMPVRPSTIQGHKALPADFQEVPFATYIICDNLYQGYLQTQSDALLDQLASVLYGKEIKLAPWEQIAIFYWMASLKDFLSRRYRDFFQPLDNGGNALGNAANAVEEAMNAQIRALTKGDITKEKDILAMDTWRALTELNAQAREYREFNAKLSTHGK